LKTKYNAALDLYADMCSHLLRRRPNCEEILEEKNKWALNELEINHELKRQLIPKLGDKNQIVFSIPKLKLNI
jgi:hypothetical protein